MQFSNLQLIGVVTNPMCPLQGSYQCSSMPNLQSLCSLKHHFDQVLNPSSGLPCSLASCGQPCHSGSTWCWPSGPSSSSNALVVTPLSYPSPSVQALTITCLKLVVSTTAMVTTNLMVLGAHLCPALSIQLQPVLKGSVSRLPLRYGPSNQR